MRAARAGTNASPTIRIFVCGMEVGVGTETRVQSEKMRGVVKPSAHTQQTTLIPSHEAAPPVPRHLYALQRPFLLLLVVLAELGYALLHLARDKVVQHHLLLVHHLLQVVYLCLAAL